MTSNSKVTVQADEQNNVIRVSKKNPEFGHIRMVQDRVIFSTQGWVNNKQLSTLIHGKVEDLTTLGYTAGQQLDGKIVTKEQLQPFNENDPDRDLKYAGDTGIVCCKHGEPIYRRTFYTLDPTEQDALISHTNSDDIRAANGVSVSANVKSEEKPMSKKEKEELKTVKEEAVEVEDETFEL